MTIIQHIAFVVLSYIHAYIQRRSLGRKLIQIGVIFGIFSFSFLFLPPLFSRLLDYRDSFNLSFISCYSNVFSIRRLDLLHLKGRKKKLCATLCCFHFVWMDRKTTQTHTQRLKYLNFRWYPCLMSILVCDLLFHRGSFKKHFFAHVFVCERPKEGKPTISSNEPLDYWT